MTEKLRILTCGHWIVTDDANIIISENPSQLQKLFHFEGEVECAYCKRLEQVVRSIDIDLDS